MLATVLVDVVTLNVDTVLNSGVHANNTNSLTLFKFYNSINDKIRLPLSWELFSGRAAAASRVTDLRRLDSEGSIRFHLVLLCF